MPKAKLNTDNETSRRMAGIRQRSTRPEMAVRLFLKSAGLRYRCNCRRLPGSPDLANKSKGWAVFVHGCFWHGHPGCSKATMPKRNREFWLQKILDNRRRDARKMRALRKKGLHVAVVWECETQDLASAKPPRALTTLLRRLAMMPACSRGPFGGLPI